MQLSKRCDCTVLSCKTGLLFVLHNSLCVFLRKNTALRFFDRQKHAQLLFKFYFVVLQAMSSVFNFTFVPWFRSVAPYIHMHRGSMLVVGLPGEAIAAGKLQNIVQDLALLHSMGMKIILVYGFRPQVSAQVVEKGHEAQFHKGIRITDAVALDCALEAAGQLRYEIEAAFSQALPNTPMAGAKVKVVSGNFVTACPMGIVDGIDYQHTGLVRKIDVTLIKQLLEHGTVVLLSPLGYSPTGEAFNLSMENVATTTASELHANKLLFLSEIEGIREQPLEPVSKDNPIDTELSLADAERLLNILPFPEKPSDMAFYLRHCATACRNGVERSHIIPYGADGSLLSEIYTHDGIGTMVVDEKLESLREANIEDVGGILQLIEPFEQDGTLVKRQRHEIERDAHLYTVIEHDSVLFGCAALYPYPESKTGEIASVTVSPQVQGQGDGDKLLRRIEQRARSMGLRSIFALTTRTTHWFLKRGFNEVDADWLPEARKRNYNWNRKSKVLVKKL